MFWYCLTDSYPKFLSLWFLVYQDTIVLHAATKLCVKPNNAIYMKCKRANFYTS